MKTFYKYASVAMTVWSACWFIYTVVVFHKTGIFQIEPAFTALFSLVIANWLHACELKEVLIYEQEAFEEQLIDLIESGAFKGEYFKLNNDKNEQQ